MTRQQEQLRTQRLQMLYGTLTENQPTQYDKLFSVRVSRTIRALEKFEYDGRMHCEHLYAYYANRPKLKGIRFDAFKKMAREYRKAARDANYAATFWRP